jgi:lysozyme
MWIRKAVPTLAATLVCTVEGTVLHPYRDGGGRWTIGCGSTRDLNGSPVTGLSEPITQAQALQLMTRDLVGAAGDLARLVSTGLNEAQASALISFIYNLGAPAASKSTLVWKLNNGEADTVPEELAKWNRVGGVPSVGLARRRWTEAATFLGGDPVNAWRRAYYLIKTPNHWPDLEWATA